MAIQENSYDHLFEDGPARGLSAMERREELANMLAEQNKPAESANSKIIDALAKQILASSNTSKWTGQGRGSVEANARDMAKIMADIGITDIKQFGPITREVQEIVGTDDGGNPIYDTQTQRTFGNKETGQVVPLTYSERQTGNFFGGTFEGKGNTGYGVQFDSQGNPIFYTQGASSNDLANLMQDMGPVFQIGLALATGGLSIPQQIAARMAVNVLSGQDMGDAIKSAAISMAVANIPGTDLMKDGAKYIKELGLDPTMTSTLTNSFQNAVTSGATAALTGQDVSDAMLRGAAAGGVNGATNALLNSADMKDLTKDLSATEKRLVSNAITGVISGKPLDQVLINSAIAAASAEAKLHKPLSDKEYNELDDKSKEIYNKSGTKALMEHEASIRGINQTLKSINAGATKNTDSGLSNQDILNMVNAGPDPAELIIAAQRKADEEAAARLAEQERQAREAQQAAARAREEANRRTAEAKSLQDAEDARKARENADRLAREAKEAEDARKAREAELLITAKRKADEEAAAAARLAEQERLAREAEDARKAKEAEDARKAKEAKDAEDARKAREAEDARKAKEAEDARKAKEAELLITAKRKADEEAAAAARFAEQERIAREAQQAAEAAARAREEADRRTAEAKNLKDAEDARKARENADRLAREAKEAELLITAKRKADEEAAAAARLAEQERLAREAEDARKAKEAEDARKAQELEAARIAELERIRQIEIENERQAEIARKAQEAEDARKAKEAELLITAKRKADDEAAAAARLAEQEELARRAQQTAKTPPVVPTSTPVPPENVVKITAPKAVPECPPGFVYDQDLKMCMPAEGTPIDTSTRGLTGTPVIPAGSVNITAPKAVPECPPGFVYDQDLKMCMPKESTGTLPTDLPKPPEVKITAPKAVPECPPGFVYDQDLKMCTPVEGTGTPTDTPLPSKGKMEIVGKKETCPVGTVLNPITGECDPVVEDKGRMIITGKRDPCPPGTVYDEILDACVPVPTPPVTPPTPTPPAPTPTPPTPPATKPPAASSPSVTLPSFTPSGAYSSSETTEPIYAGKMGDFNLFATLDELLANESGERASTKPNVKTKMATGGHLDDLLAEQMTVDDLLNLLR